MGQETTTDERIVGEAARWHARLAAADCTDFDRAEFQRWRTISRRHEAAFEAAEGLSAKLANWAKTDDRLRAMADEAFVMGVDDEEMQPGSQNAHAVARARRGGTRRWRVPAALAASVVVALIGVRISDYLTGSAPPETFASTQQTPRDVTLSDGSLIHLDVDSQINVSFSADRRDIALLNGRALFEVAHDTTRPFVVAAGQSRTTALGTHFQVQREGERVLVTLTEGSIAVTNDEGPSHWREKLSPGEQISVTADGRVQLKRAVDPQAVTSWTRGRLLFRGTPLGEALQEVNRYGTRKVRLGDPDLADLPVAGDFIAGETDLIVSAFAAVLPLRVAEGSTGEIILFRRYKTDVP
ncbi:MAG: FecR domain-containing protein [Gammaproteobacteria bacterium]